jgi:hypothetical protein
MSMMGGVLRLRAELLARLQSQPALARELVAAVRGPGAGLGDVAPALNLDKSWHVLHYLFTGHAGAEDAPGNELLSGKPIGPDLGYGPARLHDPAATKKFAEFLSPLDAKPLISRLDLRAMRALKIYPISGDSEDERAEWAEDVETYFTDLRAYVLLAAAEGAGLLVWLS